MSISNIKINGNKYELGSDAKLVATGTVDIDYMNNGNDIIFKFILNNVLSNNTNKLYLILFHSDSFGGVYSSVSRASSSAPITLIDSYTDEFIAGFAEVHDDRCYLIAPTGYVFDWEEIGGENTLYAGADDYIEVYELPFNIGGN